MSILRKRIDSASQSAVIRFNAVALQTGLVCDAQTVNTL